MKALDISIRANKTTVHGVCYTFSRSNVDYTIFRMKGSVDVWKRNNQRGTVSLDSFVSGINHLGRPMAKFLQQAMKIICAADDSSITKH